MNMTPRNEAFLSFVLFLIFSIPVTIVFFDAYPDPAFTAEKEVLVPKDQLASLLLRPGTTLVENGGEGVWLIAGGEREWYLNVPPHSFSSIRLDYSKRIVVQCSVPGTCDTSLKLTHQGWE